jgi:hypothetical protein
MRSGRSGLLAAVVICAASANPLRAQAPAAADGRPGPALFISPSGQPFRSAPGEPYPIVKWFAQVDQKGTGRIDRAAFRADAEAFFHVLDRNNDGVIDPIEVTAYEEEIVPEILGAYHAPDSDQGPLDRDAGGPRGDRRGFGGRASEVDAGAASVLDGAGPYELIPDPEPVAAADLNTDGRITLAEFLAVADRRFDRLDRKRLGYLTLADLPKPLAETAGQGGHRRPPRPDPAPAN